jgi:hypothetical protein
MPTDKTIVIKKPVRPAAHIAPLPAKKKSDKGRTVQTYRALTPLRVGDPGAETTHVRQYGDLVPEASSWRNLNTYLRIQQLEIVFMTKAEFDAQIERQQERFDEEDEAQEAANAVETERLALVKRLNELKGKQAKPEDKHSLERPKKIFESAPTPAQLEHTYEEKISFGAVPKQQGIPRPMELPTVTREVPVQRNVADNRTRPNTARVARKVKK